MSNENLSEDYKKKVIDMSNTLSLTLDEISGNVQEIARGTEKVAESGDELRSISENNLKNIENTDEVVELILSIAKKTKMLGLNASIEAARAGEMGAGFGVVAQEVGKLAEQSSESTDQVNNTLKNIKEENVLLTNKTNEISQTLEQLLSATEEISSSIEELNKFSEELKNVLKQL